MSGVGNSRFATILKRGAFPLALAAVFLFTALFRFLGLKNGFANDHFLHLAGAQQIVLGDWPTRDFVDPGLPLMYGASALAQWLLGRTLLSEAILVAIAFALAAVATALAVHALTNSRVLAISAALVEIAIVPRSYSYPKLLPYAVAFFLIQRYVTRPTNGRLFAMAAAAVTAFLFRHDHGVYLGASGMLAAWLAHEPGREPGGARRALTFLAIVGVLVAPYLLYVELFGSVWTHVLRGVEFRNAEFARQWHVWPSLFGDRPHDAALLYMYWAIPAVAALVLFASRGRDDARMRIARIAPLIVVALVVNYFFLRRPLNTRLQDAIVPAAIIGAWLTSCAWGARLRWVWRPLSLVAIAVACSSVITVGATVEELDRASLLVTWRRLPEFLEEVGSSLRARHADRQLPSITAFRMLPFYPYADRCMKEEHRVLAVGSIPEVLFFARRRFAGGMPAFIEGYFESEDEQRAVLKRLRREIVPYVVIPGTDNMQNFDGAFPILAAYVHARYVPLVTFGSDPDSQVQLLVDSELRAPSRDEETGWPCWK